MRLTPAQRRLLGQLSCRDPGGLSAVIPADGFHRRTLAGLVARGLVLWDGGLGDATLTPAGRQWRSRRRETEHPKGK